eukprot:3005104-Pyramimonas_sp.AAC.1
MCIRDRTRAAETLSLPGALAEAQWLQAFWGDLIFAHVCCPDWHLGSAPFSVVLSLLRMCHLCRPPVRS